ncbi:hypothetical protein AVEN_273561-1 [Araneus ventricosus]|uniref:Uncharacterized protein n=1 Tax=Araneus ventricosus TaxID=182803 RepID=A0A4Y2UQD6_ARAVE|nr:hypothetical protein AVEN_273561-1 [Araneus ventricosus]
MTRTTPELAPLQTSTTPHQREDALTTTQDLACKVPYTADLQWNRVPNLEPSGPKAEIPWPITTRPPRPLMKTKEN